jgi:transcriptional regulator with XRE-family HTH domain
MSLHERLRESRKLAGFATAKEAAEAFGWNKNTVTSNENGNRTFSREAAARYAKAYHVDIGWLLTGKGSPKASSSDDPETAEIVAIYKGIPNRREREAWLNMGRALKEEKS